MKDELNYISDAELEQLIYQVEQEEPVAAPPDLMESILEAAGLAEEIEQETSRPIVIPVKPQAIRKKEFYAYCFRVITSVAAAIALVFLLPELSNLMQRTDQPSEWYKQEVPRQEEVVDAIPSRDEVMLTMQTPTKDEVLNDTGLMERVLNNTGWFNKQNSEE